MAHHYDGPDPLVDRNKRIEEKQKEIEKLQNERDKLLKEEKLKNQRAVELSEKLQTLKEERSKIAAEILKTTLELNKHCTHEKIRIEEKHYEGGYLDREEYRKLYYCELCGAKVDEKVTYGGYG